MLQKIMAAVLAIGLAASPVAADKGGGKGHGPGKKEQKVAKAHGHGHGHARKMAKHRKGGRGHRSDVVVVSRARSRGPARAARVAVVVRNEAPRRVVARRDRVVFRDSDRVVVRSYFVDTWGRGNCPPGLAKKHNGCLPPGQAKKRYVIGQRLARTVIVEPLPPVLITRLAPVPVGYQYVVVDNDILLLGLATRLVADAIDWID